MASRLQSLFPWKPLICDALRFENVGAVTALAARNSGRRRVVAEQQITLEVQCLAALNGAWRMQAMFVHKSVQVRIQKQRCCSFATNNCKQGDALQGRASDFAGNSLLDFTVIQSFCYGTENAINT